MLAQSQRRPIATTIAVGLLLALFSAEACAFRTSRAPKEPAAPVKEATDEPEWDVSKQSRRFPGKGSYKTWVAANVRYDRGLALYKKRRYLEAIAHFQAARNIYPYEFAYCEILGASFRQLGELKKAERELKKGIALSARRWGLWWNLGVVLAQRKRYEEARKALVKARAYGAPSRRKRQIDKLIASIDEELKEQSAATVKETIGADRGITQEQPPPAANAK